MMRWVSASSAMTNRHAHQCCGQPWTSSSGGASSGPASATCVRSPPASIHSWVTPGREGGWLTKRQDMPMGSLEQRLTDLLDVHTFDPPEEFAADALIREAEVPSDPVAEWA